MLVSARYEGLDVVKRRGIAKELVIENIKKGSELVVDKEAKCLRIKEGKGKHVLLSRFSVTEYTKIDMFFVKGGMAIELKKGTLIADLGDGKYAKVTKSGTKSSVEYIKGAKSKTMLNSLNWVTYDTLFHCAKVFIGHKYKLELEKDKDTYVHNLAYNILLDVGGKGIGEWGISMRFINFYTDLGLDKFEFAIGDYVHVVENPNNSNSSNNNKYKKEKNMDIDSSIIDTLVGRDDISEE